MQHNQTSCFSAGIFWCNVAFTIIFISEAFIKLCGLGPRYVLHLCMYICIYIYVCMYVCMYVYPRPSSSSVGWGQSMYYTYVCMYVCVCVYIYIYMYVLLTYASTCSFIIKLYACLYMYTHTHIYIHIILGPSLHYTPMRVCMYVCLHFWMPSLLILELFACIHAYTHVCMILFLDDYVHACTYIHTYIDGISWTGGMPSTL